MEAKRQSDWNGKESHSISERGRALIDIEFITLHPHPDCIFTGPISYAGILAFLFPAIQFHVYDCEAHEAGQSNNVSRLPTPFTETHMARWAASAQPFSLIFTAEGDPKQMATVLRTSPTSTLFTLRSLPTDHWAGTLILPLFPPPGATTLFLHHKAPHRTQLMQAQTYSKRVLGEELSLFKRETQGGWYDKAAEDFIIGQALSLKMTAEGNCDATVVQTVTELLKVMLPPVD